MTDAHTLAPDQMRVAARDTVWRARLAASLTYLGGALDSVGSGIGPRLATLGARLDRGPVSPWMSCLYSKLVAEVSKAPRPPLEGLVDALERAAALSPSAPAPLALGAAEIPAIWWAQFLLLMDTDRALPFRPGAPTGEAAVACATEIAAAMALARRADPPLADEIAALVRIIVLGAPSDPDPANSFGACSSFFMRETVLVNAALRRSRVRMLDLLVHEASHVLLFSLAIEQPLTTDRGEKRLKSAARPDLRPVDGVFHACFVATRVHLAMRRLIGSGALDGGEAREAAERRDRNGAIAEASLATLQEHAATTPLGAEVLSNLALYWAEQAAPETAAGA